LNPSPLPSPPWIEHPADFAVVNQNIAALDVQFQASKGHRESFSLNLVREWHREMHTGCCHVPVAAYVGNFRGTTHPYLEAYENQFGPFISFQAADVPTAVLKVEAEIKNLLDRFDLLMGNEAAATPSRLNNVIDAVVGPYVDWIRIHPFADGNGRTARLMVNWLFARYWQPLVFPGRPPVDRDSLVAATAPALFVPSNYRPIRSHLRKRLADARRSP